MLSTAEHLVLVPQHQAPGQPHYGPLHGKQHQAPSQHPQGPGPEHPQPAGQQHQVLGPPGGQHQAPGQHLQVPGQEHPGTAHRVCHLLAVSEKIYDYYKIS